MKITVIGTINRDILRFPQNKTVESMGGAIYTILTLAILAPKEVEIFPLASVGTDIYSDLCRTLSRYLNINLSGITRVSCLNNVVYLQLSPGKERCEHTEINLPTMSFAQIEPYLDCNALILNFTSGYELNLETVERVLELFTGIIYIDIHSLTLGIDENRHRYRRKIPQWHRWIIGAHFIQLTADEAWSFYTGEDFNLEAAKTVGREISKFAKIACIMTFGPEGVLVFTKEGEFKVDVVKVEAPVDTTGCGDVLGASFLWRYLETEETLNSIEFAVQMATKKCTFSGIEKMQRLKEI